MAGLAPTGGPVPRGQRVVTATLAPPAEDLELPGDGPPPLAGLVPLDTPRFPVTCPDCGGPLYTPAPVDEPDEDEPCTRQVTAVICGECDAPWLLHLSITRRRRRGDERP
jgi:hypothetical protein